MIAFKFLDEFFIPKTRVFELSVDEVFVILACVVFTQCQRVTDRRTDGQTDRRLADDSYRTGLAATLTPCKNSLSVVPCLSPDSSEARFSNSLRLDPKPPNSAAEPKFYSSSRKTAEKFNASRKTARKKRRFSRFNFGMIAVFL